MDIILHIGSHRTGTTTFQHYIRDNLTALSARKLGFWGPRRTRKGLFAGLYPGPAAARGRNVRRRAEGRVRMHAEMARAAGLSQLIVSEENMMGAPRDCLRRKSLYPAVGERMARVSSAFGGQVTRIVLSVRSQDLWWSSVAAYAVARGHAVPGLATLDAIADNRRSWRDVITDLACAAPEAEIVVVPFEQVAGQPDTLLRHATGLPQLPPASGRWMNKSLDLADLRRAMRAQGGDVERLPDGFGRWQPFLADQTAMLREAYADDIMWLTAGADGLARLTNDTNGKRAGQSLPPAAMTRGMTHDQGQGRLAQSG